MPRLIGPLRRFRTDLHRPRSPWTALVPVVALTAGLLFAVSAATARGTDLRSGPANVADVVRQTARNVGALQRQASSLEDAVAQRTTDVGTSDAAVGALQRKARALSADAGLTARSGGGLVITMGDSDRTPDPDLDPNHYVIHQSDIQAVMNALWAGGAEAIAVADQRIITTSVVRCVGSTVLVNGQLFSSPFTVEAIGPTEDMRQALDRSSGVSLLRQAVEVLGVRFEVATSDAVAIAAYTAPTGLQYATVPS